MSEQSDRRDLGPEDSELTALRAAIQEGLDSDRSDRTPEDARYDVLQRLKDSSQESPSSLETEVKALLRMYPAEPHDSINNVIRSLATRLLQINVSGREKPSDQHDYKALYHELIFEVGSKWPGETRHETAKRYIREHETPCPGCRGDSDKHICHEQCASAATM